MAVQFGVAWSSDIKGVGIVAGGPYYCAQASLADNMMTGGAGPMMAAAGPCMAGPPGDLGPRFKAAQDKAASGDIDSLDNLARQKIYIFHGYNDKVVARPVTDATARFYEKYLGDRAAGNLYYQAAIGAGHSYVVPEAGNPKLEACPANKLPYIDQCGYDQAGVILQHIYGALNPPSAVLGGTLKSFDQSAYTGSDIPDALSMADEGFVYVPKDCAGGAACRVHVALHGCQQDVGKIGKLFVEEAGYNRWADSNRIIVLYPQAKASPFLPMNPAACWDWWGYVTFDDSYVTKSGRQIAAIKAMLDALTSGAKGGAVAAGAPFALTVNDRSDAQVDLVWTAAPNASAYRVFRAGADGQYRPVGEVANGLSFADRGLAPATSYSWRVAPMVAGAAQAPSNTTSATTLGTPAPCASPGACPLPIAETRAP